MAEYKNEALDSLNQLDANKIRFLFDLAKAKLEKVESKIGDFLKSHGFDKIIAKDYDGKIDKATSEKKVTQIEQIYNRDIKPLLSKYKDKKFHCEKKRLIIELATLIERAEIQERFYLSQNKGIEVDHKIFSERHSIEKELTNALDVSFSGVKSEKQKGAPSEDGITGEMQRDAALLTAGRITQAEFSKRYFAHLETAGHVGGLPMQARVLEKFGEIAKPLMSTGLAPMLLTLSRRTRAILPGLPVLIGGGIYASLFLTLKSDKISGKDKAIETGKTVGETILNVAPITGTFMSAWDTIKAIKKGNKSEAIACGIGTVVSAGFDVMTVVMVASGVGIPGAVGLQSLKNATIRGAVKFGLKPVLKYAAKESVEKATKVAAKVTTKQVVGKILKEGTKFVGGNLKVAGKALIKKETYIGVKSGGELASKGLMHETIDGAKQIFTFKHARDAFKDWRSAKLYAKHPEKLKMKNPKKYEELRAKELEAGEKINSVQAAESRLAEHNAVRDDDAEMPTIIRQDEKREASLLHDSESRRVRSVGKTEKSILDKKYDGEELLPKSALSRLEATKEAYLQKKEKGALKFDAYIAAMEKDSTLIGTEDLLKKLETELLSHKRNLGSMEYANQIIMKMKDKHYKYILESSKIDPSMLTVAELQKIYDIAEKERTMAIYKDRLDEKAQRIEKLLDLIKKRANSEGTASHQEVFYMSTEKLLKGDNIDNTMKCLLLEHLTQEHIAESLLNSGTLEKVVNNIIKDRNIPHDVKLNFLISLKTEKNVTHLDPSFKVGTEIEKSAQEVLDGIIRDIKSFEEGNPPKGVKLKDLFYGYSKLSKGFNYNLDMKLDNVCNIFAKSFNQFDAPSKVLFVRFLKKMDMLNYYIEAKDGGFANSILEILKRMKSDGSAESLRGAFNLAYYLEGTRFSGFANNIREYHTGTAKTFDWGGKNMTREEFKKNMETATLESVKANSSKKDRDTIFSDPRKMAEEHKHDFSGEHFDKELMDNLVMEVFEKNKDLNALTSYLLELSRDPKASFSDELSGKVLTQYFQDASKNVDDIKRFAKEFTVYAADQIRFKNSKHLNEVGKSIIEAMKSLDSSDHDLTISLCRMLESTKTKFELKDIPTDLGKTYFSRRIISERNVDSGMFNDNSVKGAIKSFEYLNPADPVDLLYKIDEMRHLKAIVERMPKKVAKIFNKSLFDEGAKFDQAIAMINNPEIKSKLIQEMFGTSIHSNKGTRKKDTDMLALLSMDLEITPKGDVFLVHKGEGSNFNKSRLDLRSKNNARHDFIEAALSNSTLVNSENGENTLKVAKLLSMLDSETRLRLEESTNHVKLSHIIQVVNDSKMQSEISPDKVYKFLEEHESKSGQQGLGERFAIQTVLIEKYLANPSTKLETIKYLEDFLSKSDSSLLEHQLALLSNLGSIPSKAQKKNFKVFILSKIKDPELLSKVVESPVFREINSRNNVDYKNSNGAITDEICTIALSDRNMNSSDFKRLFALVEVIKGNKKFYSDLQGSKDSIRDLKKALFTLAENKDNELCKSMYEKLLEVKALISDPEVMRYIGKEISSAKTMNNDTVVLINRFFDGVYSGYKESSKVGFNLHDMELMKEIAKALEKLHLGTGLRGSKMSPEDLKKKLGIEIVRKLDEMKIDLDIKGGEIVFIDKNTGKSFANIEAINAMRIDMIAHDIKAGLTASIRSTIGAIKEFTDESSLRQDILKNLDANTLEMLKKYDIDFALDKRLLAVMKFISSTKASAGDIKVIEAQMKELGISVRQAKGTGDLEFMDSESGEKLNIGDFFKLIDKKTNKEFDGTGIKDYDMFGSFLSKASSYLKYFRISRALPEDKKEEDENAPKVAENTKIGENRHIALKAEAQTFKEQTVLGKAINITKGKKFAVLGGLAITLGLMTPKKAQAMEQTALDEAERSAQKELDANAEYNAASTSAERKKAIKEETIRRHTVMKVQSMLDSMQMIVDRKIDELVERGVDKVIKSRLSESQKAQIKLMFKEEMYRYFASKPGTELENSYDKAQGTTISPTFLMSQSLKNNPILESEIEDIIRNINERMSPKMDDFSISDTTKFIWYEFDTLK